MDADTIRPSPTWHRGAGSLLHSRCRAAVMARHYNRHNGAWPSSGPVVLTVTRHGAAVSDESRLQKAPSLGRGIRFCLWDRSRAGKDPVAEASVAIPSGDVGEVWRKLRCLGRWSERKLELELQ